MDNLSFQTPGKIKVLMTGAGAPGGPGIIKALQKGPIELHTGDCNAFASGRFLSDKFIELPKAENDDFINFILQYCIENSIQLIFPLVTKELFKFSEHKQLFTNNNIKVLVSDFESLSIANDKGKLYQHLYRKGIAVPSFKIACKVDEVEKSIVQLGYPNKAVCIKPTVSNGSRGVRILQEDVDEFDLLFNYKPTNLYSSLQKTVEILGKRPFPEMLISEYLPGDEYTIDTIVNNGVPKLILPRIRTKMNGGISVQGTFLNNEKIIAYCDEIIRSLNLSGPIGLQVKEDSSGEFRLLEINPRIQGTSVAALGAGINLPLLSVMQEFEEIDFPALPVSWGTSFVRYYAEVFY